MDLQKDSFPTTKNTPLIIRASQILALFIALALTGMVASVLVSENINSNAEKINMVGSLQMLAFKTTAAHSTDKSAATTQEVINFQKQLDLIQIKNQGNFRSDHELSTLFNQVEQTWNKIKKQQASLIEKNNFALEINNLEKYFQQKIKQEIHLLRIIQYLGVFMMVLVSYVTIYRSQDSLITPFKLLTQVATEAGRGNFTLQADETAKGELGQVAASLNEMSRQLSLTYQDLERNVAHKTTALEQSNRTLGILYRTAHNLSSTEQPSDLTPLLSDLELTLGEGTIKVNLTGQPQTTATSLSHDKHTNQYPINKHGHSFGTLIWTTELKPATWQEELLKAMANLIATSFDLQHKRRSDSLLEIMEERAVIARELHDSLAQSLSYLKLQISLLNKQYQKGLPQEEISPTINEISRGTNLAYKQLREILTTFRLKLDDESIEKSIQQAVNEFSEKCLYTIDSHYRLDNKAMNPHQEIHLLQIIREALSNIHKHSQATASSIDVLIENNEVQVEITDNGCGLPEAASKEGHFGLKIMDERAKSLGGILRFEQNTPHGTRLSLHFKINPDS